MMATTVVVISAAYTEVNEAVAIKLRTKYIDILINN